MEHTDHCIKNFQLYERLIREYNEKYPNHCRKCGGWGGFHYPGNYYNPPEFDPCTCIEDGICPRCGKKTFPDDEVETCSVCGWNIEEPDGAPEQPECFCDYEIEHNFKELEL